ncbi:MAG: 5-formyltetrahydrofolate cyclo-ligase [Prevotella sp.]|nr:5-formyltetrahydrofolate cyclo-ligase [Prevotella sp.]
MENLQTKDALRREIAALKKQYASSDLLAKSEEVFSVLEITGLFQNAQTILIYNSLNGEVSTSAFLSKWAGEKEFFLPVVSGNNLVVRKYEADSKFVASAWGIQEPVGIDIMNYDGIDLAIIPGIAFDRKLNRLGRGKGYYDRFLPALKAPKIGVCFDFQLFDAIPTAPHDVKMNLLVSENEIVW